VKVIAAAQKHATRANKLASRGTVASPRLAGGGFKQGGRLPQHKVGFQDVLAPIRSGHGALDIGHEGIEGEPGEFRLRHLNGGQGRDHELGKMNIVETQHREIFGNRDSGLVAAGAATGARTLPSRLPWCDCLPRLNRVRGRGRSRAWTAGRPVGVRRPT